MGGRAWPTLASNILAYFFAGCGGAGACLHARRHDALHAHVGDQVAVVLHVMHVVDDQRAPLAARRFPNSFMLCVAEASVQMWEALSQ